MRISKQISGSAERRDAGEGQGRGEYEWSELLPTDPTADELLDRRISIRVSDDILTDTQCIFGHVQGKYRIRRADGVTGRELYPPWHAAAILMMPKPIRAETSWGDGLPVMRNGQYGIEHLHLGQVDATADGQATVGIRQVEVANHYTRDLIDFPQRFVEVCRVWRSLSSFGQDLQDAIREHEEAVREQHPEPRRIFGVIGDIQRILADSGTDYGIMPNTPTTDPLPSLLEIIDLKGEADPPTIIAEIPPEEIKIRLRETKRIRRMVNARGPSSARFRKDVRNAYRSTCVVCGLYLPTTGPGTNPGVDAAHILPWTTYDLDHVSNGLCLCKLHHWAFDEFLIQIQYEDGRYSVVVPREAVNRIDAAQSDISLDFLREHEGEVPGDRMPHRVSDRPRPEFLQRLSEYILQ